MNDDIRSMNDPPYRAELSGVLLEAVQQIRREPVAGQALVRVLEGARQIETPRPVTRRGMRRRLVVGSSIAAALLIVGLVLWNRPSDTWAQVVQAVAEKPWLHATGKDPNGEGRELWFSSKERVFCARHGRTIIWYDYRRQTVDIYDSKDHTILRVPWEKGGRERWSIFDEMFRTFLSGNAGQTLAAGSCKLRHEQERIARAGPKRWIEHRLSLDDPRGRKGVETEIILRVDPNTRLPFWWKRIYRDPGRDVESVEQWDVDYPASGPASLYDMGVPETAKLLDRVPQGDLATLVAGMKAARQQFDSYCAVVVESHATQHWSRGILVHRVWRSGNRWRTETCGGLDDLLRGQELPGTDAEPAKWWMQKVGELPFYLKELSDGKTHWCYRPVATRAPTQQEQDRGAAKRARNLPVEKRSAEPVEQHDPLPRDRLVLPEFRGHPWIRLRDRDFEAKVDPKPFSGPPGTVLLELRNVRWRPREPHPQFPEEQQHYLNPRAYRYWIDPLRSYLVMRIEQLGIVDGAEKVVQEHVIEEVKKSPRGHWYPTVYRIGFYPIKGERSDDVWRYYVDFDAPIPNSLFEAPK